MTIDNFVSQRWAAELLPNLDNAHVYKKCTNQDYEGEIKAAGDSVRILMVGDLSESAYVKNSSSITYEVPDSADLSLVANLIRTISYKIDDVDKVQAKGNYRQRLIQRMAYRFANTVDVYLASTVMSGAVASDNQLDSGGTRVIGTGAGDADAYETIVDLAVKLDEANVPGDSRFCVVPPWFHGMLKKDPRFSSFGTDANRRSIRGDPIGEVETLTLYKSNNVPLSGSLYTILAGSTIATCFAEQLPTGQPEAIRLETAIADGLRCLYIYGAKVTLPDALASVVVQAA